MYEIPPTALTNNLATALRAVFFHISTHIRVQAPCYCQIRSEHRERNSDCYQVNRVSDTVSVRIYALCAQHLRVHRRQKRKVSGGMKYRLRHSQTTLQQLCALSFFIYPLISVCKHPAIVRFVASIASVIAIATKSIASATRCRCAYMRYVRSTFESTVGKNEK